MLYRKADKTAHECRIYPLLNPSTRARPAADFMGQWGKGSVLADSDDPGFHLAHSLWGWREKTALVANSSFTIVAMHWWNSQMSDSVSAGRGCLGILLHSLQTSLHAFFKKYFFLLLILPYNPFAMMNLAYEQWNSKQNPQVLKAPLPDSEVEAATVWANLPGGSLNRYGQGWDASSHCGSSDLWPCDHGSNHNRHTNQLTNRILVLLN